MPKWTDYTIKTDPADKDEVMILDAAGKANKRLGLSALSDWIIGKIANKVFENLQTQNKTILGAINELNSKTKIGNIRYISCGEYGTLAIFTVGKLLYCKFNGNAKDSQSAQANVAQLPDEYILTDSIGAYRAVLVKDGNTNIGNIQIKTDGNVDIYCPYPFLYGIVIIPIK